MAKKYYKYYILLSLLIVISCLIGISYYVGLNIGRQKASLETIRGIDIEKIEKIDYLFKSKAIWMDVRVNGIVRDISDNTLIIEGFSSNGEEFPLLEIPIASDASIVLNYGLSGEPLEEEIKRPKIRMFNEVIDLTEYKVEQKYINFEGIKVGDTVSVSLRINPDYSIEGVFVRVQQEDFNL